MVDVGKFFSKLRTVKDEYEISRIFLSALQENGLFRMLKMVINLN